MSYEIKNNIFKKMPVYPTIKITFATVKILLNRLFWEKNFLAICLFMKKIIFMKMGSRRMYHISAI